MIIRGGLAQPPIRPVLPAIITALSVVFIAYLVMGFRGASAWTQGRLFDPDCYMHLERARELWKDGSWYDSRSLRVSPPEGHTQHWTRPLDVLILAPAYAVNRILKNPDASLLAVGMFEPVLSLAMLVPLFLWAFRLLIPPTLAWSVPFLLVMQPAVFFTFQPGRSDNPFLSAILFVLFMGILLRLVAGYRSKRIVVGFGLVSALSIWHTVESCIYIALAFLILALFWALDENPKLSTIRNLAYSVTALTGVAIVLERAYTDWSILEMDRVSSLHFLILSLNSAVWTVLCWIQTRGDVPLMRSRAGRVSTLVTVAALQLPLLMWLRLIKDPLGKMDSLYAVTRFPLIGEYRPVFNVLGNHYVGLVLWPVAMLLIPLISAPILWNQLVTSHDMRRRKLTVISIFVATFFVATCIQIHWAMYLQLITVLPICFLLARIAKGLWARKSAVQAIMRPLVIGGFIMLPYAPMASISRATHDQEERSTVYLTSDVIRYLSSRDRFPEPLTILAHVDLGPELLFRTQHRVLSIPNHRPQRGYDIGYQILGEEEEEDAVRLLRRERIDLILIFENCEAELRFYGRTGGDERLYKLLAKGDPPPGIERLKFPDCTNTGGAVIFRVDQE